MLPLRMPAARVAGAIQPSRPHSVWLALSLWSCGGVVETRQESPPDRDERPVVSTSGDTPAPAAGTSPQSAFPSAGGSSASATDPTPQLPSPGPTAPPSLEQACSVFQNGAPSDGPAPFASSSDALAALQDGAWMLCENAGTYPFDGFVVSGEYWHHLRRDASGFSHLEGFGHEGFMQVVDRGDGGWDAPYQIDFLATAWNWYGASLYPGRLQIQLDGRLPFVWMVQAAVVAAPQELPFEPGERAGAAACAFGERGMRNVAMSATVATQALSGRWLRCSGELPEVLEFEGRDTLLIRDQQGALQSTTTFRFGNELPDTGNLPGTLFLSLGSLDGIEAFNVALSETPLKLYLTVVSPDRERLLVSIYTALP